MNVFKPKMHSLIWPILFLIAGITVALYGLTSYIGLTTSLFIGTIVLLALIGYFADKKLYYILLHLFCLSLFFLTGWGITTFQNNEYDRHAQELSGNKHPTGTINAISHYSKMTRIHVRAPSTNWWTTPHYFNINLLAIDHQFHEGQIIVLAKPLEIIESSKNPFTFQAKEYWKTQNTSHEVFIHKPSEINIIKNYPLSIIERIRQSATHRIDKLYPNPTQAGLLKAMLLGQKEGISKAQKEDFKKSGLMHILAVSGLHVGIISAILFFILLPIKLLFPKSWLHCILVLLILWIYAALTGMNTPVVRAVILATFYLTASRIDRKIDKWNIYFWAILIILIIHPTSLFTISFQLSFGAVASILLFYNKFHECVSPLLGNNYFSDLAAVSLAAQTGIFPLLLFYFQEFSMIGTLSSLLVIPLLFPMMLIAFASILTPDTLSLISSGLSKVGQIILELITQLSNALAGWDIASSIWVWNIFTLGLIFTAMLLAGLYLETMKKNSSSWMRYGWIGCLILAGLSEGYNIYSVRNHPIVAIYENKDQPIIDLYYLGICYTNNNGFPPPYLTRSRKAHYTTKSISIPDNTYWENLITAIRDQYLDENFQGDEIIHVYNYSKFKDYFVNMLPPVYKASAKNIHYNSPALISLNLNK